MLSEKQQAEVAREFIRKAVIDAHCENRQETMAFLTVMISQCAWLIEKRSNPDNAQCALYVPYELLNQKIALQEGGQDARNHAAA